LSFRVYSEKYFDLPFDVYSEKYFDLPFDVYSEKLITSICIGNRFINKIY